MKIRIDNKKEVFNGCEPYIIAEIGANHNGDMNLAKEMILSAKENGADCVKFQSWSSTSLIAKEEYDRNQVYNDGDGGKKHFGTLKEMVTKYALGDKEHHELKEFCDENGIVFNSTPFSTHEAELLNKMGVPFFKVASMDINYTSLLKELASYNKPIILSTGMSTLAEIDNAINTIYKCGNDKVILLHCISIYPPKYEDIHLNNITTLQNTFGLPVGFSDHTIGTSIPLASCALGACIIEKHFTTDKNLPGWDHDISADPDELKIITTESKNIVKSLGSFTRKVSEAEENKKMKFRRSLVLNREIKKGEVITEADITAKRPGTQISPDRMDMVIGRKASKNLNYDHVIKLGDLE